jgi:prepilin-type processing-associated H-X9-DG protein
VDKSLLVFSLAFLEQSPVYNAINQNLTILGVENLTVHPVAIPTFACPSDPMSGQARSLNSGALSQYGISDPAQMVFASYAGCLGSLEVTALPLPSANCIVAAQQVQQSNGVFPDISPIRMSSVTDGLSNTVFMAEKSTTVLKRLDIVDPTLFAEYGWYITGNWGDTLISTFYPPNAYNKVALSAMKAWRDSASSLHPGGLNVLLGDGSVRFIKDSIQSWPFEPLTGAPAGVTFSAQGWWLNVPTPGVWQALSTRAGGEIVGGGDF